MNIVRQKAYLTGLNGSYTTDTVKGMSSELSNINGFNGSMDNSYIGDYNYNDAYRGGMTGTVLLGQPNYNNPNNVLHNNIGEKVLAEQTFDNKIFIDTSLKDYSKHPEPFKFVVKFTGTEAEIDTISVQISDEKYCYPKYLKGDTDIIINGSKSFRNIQCVTINALILPIHVDYKTNDDGSYQIAGTCLAKAMIKYIVLKINELTNGRCYSNNKNIGPESFIMKMDYDMCVFNQLWIPVYDTICYPQSQLKTIDKLSVEICDDKGDRICPKLDGKPYDFFAEYRKLIDKMKELQKMNTSESKKKIEILKPKLKSLRDIVAYLPPELHLTFNTYEPQIDTKPQFRY
jgi:hypothetical protein